MLPSFDMVFGSQNLLIASNGYLKITDFGFDIPSPHQLLAMTNPTRKPHVCTLTI